MFLKFCNSLPHHELELPPPAVMDPIIFRLINRLVVRLICKGKPDVNLPDQYTALTRLSTFAIVLFWQK